METITQNKLELMFGKIQLEGVKLVVGREYPIGDKNLKCKYLGLVQSTYDKPQGMPDTWVHRFVLGKVKDGEITAITQVEILKDNLQLTSEGVVVKNNETKYPARIYFPMPADEMKGDLPSFNRLVKFSRFSQFLEEGSK